MRKTTASLALLALLAAALLLPLPQARAETAAPDSAGQDLLTLRAGSVIEDDVVRLRDLFDGIADPAVAETPVAKAPQPGASIDVGARWLAAVAKAHGLPWQPRSRYERINLRRDSHDIAGEEIEEALRTALADQGLDGEVRLSFDQPGLRLRLPSTAERSLRVTRLTLDPSSGRFLAHVVAPAAGEPKATLSVTGRALEMTEVPVLTRRVNPGEVIRARDIEWMSVQANRLTRTTVVDVASMIGMSPRRPIRAQDLVRSTDLQSPVMVTKNTLVTIRLQTSRMQLTVQGRALEDGAEGDVVRVMNTKSNTVVNAVVVGGGSVIVVPATVTAER
ncbi:flagellar basal body P-ring formation chaperone FlgA [Pelagibius marinus]|uniref:flagellar basal body P-ring formation chaperone FlgA n=1 Tax=Pelagibius marinus TaxID=2762760 RepID=UPI00187222DA|nr:flagellar basal body P-ring formation chaperone FlgA [Pelagibius marinus]